MKADNCPGAGLVEIMKVRIRVVPGSRKNQVCVQDELLKVYLTAPPLDGRANEALIELLSRHFSVRRSAISIIKGLKSRDKIISIETI